MLPWGEGLLAGHDRNIRAIKADLDFKPAAVFGRFGFFDPKGRRVAGSQVFNLVQFVQGQPLPRGHAGHGA